MDGCTYTELNSGLQQGADVTLSSSSDGCNLCCRSGIVGRFRQCCFPYVMLRSWELVIVRDRVNRVGIVRNIIRGGSDPPSLPPRGPNQRAIWSRTRAKPGANGSAKRVVATRRPPKERRSGERSRLRHRHVDGISSKRRTRGWTQRVGGGKNADAVGDATGSRAGPQSAEPPTQASHLVQTPGGPSPGIRRLVSNSDGFGFTRRPLRRWVAGMDLAWSKQGEEGWPEGGGGLCFAAIAVGDRVAVSFREKGGNSDPFLPKQISTRSHNICGPIDSTWDARLYCSVARIVVCILYSFLLRHPNWGVCLPIFMCNFYWPIIGRQLSLSSKSCSLMIWFHLLFLIIITIIRKGGKRRRERAVHVTTLFDGARKRTSRRPDQTARRV
ncbi:hypothetical protein GW17_00005925 [Ensete ventricosum]|nr:hypothetical protein GW17_00005925 [Ensete ventricosum]